MATLHESVKIFASEAKKANRDMEKFVKASPAFRKAKDKLITITGKAI